MQTIRVASAVALLVSSATISSLAAPSLALDDPEAGNLPPVAVDDSATVASGGSVVVDVLVNDSDPDGTSTSTLDLVGVVAGPGSGVATAVSSSVEYTPTDGFTGTDTFSYEISDGELTDTAAVTVTVTDTPNNAPVANADTAQTRWGVPIAVDVTLNDTDTDGEQLTIIETGRPEHGRAEIVKGKVRFTPVGEYVGPSVVPYTVQDPLGASATGVLTVQVRPAFTVALRGMSTPVALRGGEVRGVVSTRLDGPVMATLQRWNGQGWRTVSNRTVRGDDRFELRWRPQQPGREVLRLAARWEDGHSATTPRHAVNVEARFDPEVSRVTAKDVPHTWRPGCPVGPGDLRAIRMSYWDYHGRLQRGTLVGAEWVTDDYIAVFRHAFDKGFPIKKMYPADRYGGVDERAMRAGNTSAFNCRHVTGNPYRMSQHSYGNAIDINTFENPYVTGSRVYPPKAAVPYYFHRDRNLRDPGVITARSPMARALWGRGWAWGARWALPDYQHWSSNGG